MTNENLWLAYYSPLGITHPPRLDCRERVMKKMQIEVKQGAVQIQYVSLTYESDDCVVFHIETAQKYTRLLATGGGAGERRIMIGLEEPGSDDYDTAAVVGIKGAFADFDVECAEVQRYRVIWMLCRSVKAKRIWMSEDEP